MNKKKKIVLSIILVFVSICSLLFLLNINNKTENIDTILSSKYYSYLPMEAKNYIREYYEQTGEILLTEKNKEENVQYLNPGYVYYLASTEEEKKEYGYIPPSLIVDYVYGTSPANEKYPETFDLRNVDGKNFVTPVQDQFGGLCWAYSSTAQIEGLLLVNSNQSYSTSSTVFSERQLDYATSKDGIVENKSLYPYRLLHDEGGAYSWPWSVEVDGLSLVSYNWEENIGDSTSKLEPNLVYNFNNSLYEVDNTVIVPNLNLATLDKNSEEDMNKREEYLNIIKGIVKNYGGAVVGSIDPTGKCSVATENTRLIYDNNKCTTGGGHAMEIIGWDDNFEYSFCEKTDSISSDVSSCPENKIVRGKGVWILKNSWGENYLPNPYLAYDNYNLTISAVKSVDTKNWDNYYHSSAEIGSTKAVVEKDINTSEKIQKIKININSSQIKNDKLDLYVSLSNDNYQLVGSIETDLPGFYTLDVSDKNLISNEKEIKFQAKYGNSYFWFISGDDVRIYTSNVNDDKYIQTEDYTYEPKYTTQSNYEIRLNQITKGLLDNSIVSYKILNKDNEEIETEYSYTENKVYANKIFPKIIIDNSLSKGEYKIQTIYNGSVKSESSLIIQESPVVISGEGTKSNPYIITNSSQLNLIRNNRFAYYILGNDIDLTYDTTNEDGLFYNDGLGWEPIECGENYSERFAGSFDGNGYKIKGLYINRPEEDYVGLFRNMYSYGTDDGKQINLVNVILENPNITGNNYVGGIAGNIDAQSSIYTVNLQKLYVIGGKIKGNNYVGGIAGSLKAGVYYDSHANRIHSLFNSSTITANNYAGGIFGHIENTHIYSGMKVFIKNIINIGSIKSEGNASGLVGNVKMKHTDPINIENALNIGIVNGKNCSSGITCELDESSDGKFNLKNIYYIDDYGYDTNNDNITANNVLKKQANNISDVLNYSNWDLFNNYWKIENSDNIVRIPTLKDMSYTYISSSIDKILLSPDENININDNITSDYDITYSIIDSSIATIDDGVITGIDIGQTVLIISSKYEQLIIPIYVISSDEYNISFDKNGGQGTMESQSIILDDEKAIPENKFTKEGYKFKEWNTQADGKGLTFRCGQSVLDLLSLDNDIVLYAQWIPIKYTIIFHSNEGLDRTDEQVLTYDKKEKLTESFIYGSYVFLSWNTKADGSGTSYEDKQEVLNLTNEDGGIINLYSIWKKYKVSYNSNGGKGTMNDSFIYCGDSEPLTLNSFTKEGYHFGHWNTQADDKGTSYSNGRSITLDSDLELYAIWYPNNYGITWYNEDGTKYKIGDNFYDVEYEASGYKWTLNTGYKFKEWNTKIDGSGTSYKEGEKFKNLTANYYETIKLYAIIAPIDYKITYYANNGNEDSYEDKLKYNSSANLTKNTFTKEGYKFKEWNTQADGSGTSYEDEQEVLNLTTQDNDNIELYAIWESCEYKITYYANGGQGAPKEQSVGYNTKVKLTKNTFTKEGYKFKEWNTKIDGSGTSYSDEQEISLSQNIKLYAQWNEGEPYTIKRYSYISGKKYIDKIDVNTIPSVYKQNIELATGYSIDVESKNVDGKDVLYTGSKTRIKKEEALIIEFTNIVSGDTNGDGKLNYLDYVNVYNHIQKVKHPESTKKILTNEYLVAGDMSGDTNINYLDYVKIYQKIKELKGGN